MSVDKLVDSTQLDSDLTSVANAIRTKSGGSGQLAFPSGFVGAIDAIPTGDGITIDDFATHDNVSGAITLTTATEIDVSAFENTAITSLYSNSVTNLKYGCCRNCSQLTTVNLPEVTSFANSAQQMFANDTSLVSVYLPKLYSTSSNTGVFSGCSSLTVVDLGKLNSFYNSFFQNCTALRTLILRKTGSVCSTNWWNATVFGGIYNNPTESTIYVPNDLISSYQNATNWSSAYAAGVTFKKIEGSIYEL